MLTLSQLLGGALHELPKRKGAKYASLCNGVMQWGVSEQYEPLLKGKSTKDFLISKDDLDFIHHSSKWHDRPHVLTFLKYGDVGALAWVPVWKHLPASLMFSQENLLADIVSFLFTRPNEYGIGLSTTLRSCNRKMWLSTPPSGPSIVELSSTEETTAMIKWVLGADPVRPLVDGGGDVFRIAHMPVTKDPEPRIYPKKQWLLLDTFYRINDMTLGARVSERFHDSFLPSEWHGRLRILSKAS